MIILTIVASLLACLVIGALVFTLVGLRRRRRSADPDGSGHPGERNN